MFRSVKSCFVAVSLMLMPFGAHAEFDDQHSVEAIVEALQLPISDEMLQQAREFDDQLMSEGLSEGQQVYLVTDERSDWVNAVVERLLVSVGGDPSHWIVRVLDTHEPVVNAYVTGGKYIYIFTGFLDQASSEDEIAMVLGHELGHSLLQQFSRREDDQTFSLANLALLAASLSEEHSEGFINAARALVASYGRVDEEEADALGVAIARRAGFNPLRGADFFGRSKRQADEVQNEYMQVFAEGRQNVEQTQIACQQWTQYYNSAWQNQTNENYQQLVTACQAADAQRNLYNQYVQEYNQMLQAQQAQSYFDTHPADQSRIAAIAALTDYLNGRRDLQSIAKYEQSHRVMQALAQIDSVLLKEPIEFDVAEKGEGEATGRPENQGADLTQQLADLKQALDKGLITRKEYERKRTEIVSRY